MRVLAIVHKAVPIHNAGAEWMLHAILKRFVEHGHQATVVYPGAPTYRLDGVVVTSTSLNLHGLALEHDVVLTHLDKTELAVRTAETAGRPLVHLVHNDRQLQFHRVRPGPDVLVVPNSEWIAEALKWPGAQIICRPPVSTADYRTTPGDAITLVNLTHSKGADVFYRLAAELPSRPFLAVAGAYGVQERRRAMKLPNVELVEQTADVVGDVYAKTRVVLMPSVYESWGRVAVEAGASGIPTIAHPTPGLLESLGTAGIFVDRADLNAWRRAITDLDDPAVYRAASAAARARAVELERITDRDLALLEAAIAEHVEEHAHRQGPAYHRPDAMTILSSITAGMRCPVCSASSCACAPDAKTVGAGLEVKSYPASARGLPLKMYRTWRGDFKLNELHAIRQGLIVDPETPDLPRSVDRRITPAAPHELERAERAYRGANDQAKAHFLAEVATRNPRALAADIVALVDDLEANVEPEAPAGDGGAGEVASVVSGRVGDVVAWVGLDPERAAEALDAERVGKGRKTLMGALEALAGGQ